MRYDMLYAFQQFARRKRLAPSCRLVYLNLLIRADIEGREVFEMDNKQLMDFTGLNKNTITAAKATLKNHKLIDWSRYEIQLGRTLVESVGERVKKVSGPSKKEESGKIKLKEERAGDVAEDNGASDRSWERYYD